MGCKSRRVLWEMASLVQRNQMMEGLKAKL